MVKEFLIAYHLVNLSGKKYVKMYRKNSFFQKPKNIPFSTINEGGDEIQSLHL